MKNRIVSVLMLLVLLVSMTSNAQAISAALHDQIALVYVNLGSPDGSSQFASTGLPMYALVDGGLLTGADQSGQQALRETGLSFQVVDPDLKSGSYYLAEVRSSRPAPNFALFGQVLLSTAHGALLRMDPSQVDALAQAGAELRRITLDPKPLPPGQAETTHPEAVVPDPLVQVMIDQVTTEKIYQYDRELAGEIPVWVDGDWYTITTRYTNSGTPIQKTTHYVGERLAIDLGPENVEYHVWSNNTNPNVIGELPGLINPDQIYIIGGHIDDVSGTPGADDNASGSVATLLAADILSQFQWGCTLRFAFWTGEEQGLWGSHYYAQRAYQNGENILGYLNLDMIAWNTIGSDPVISLFYSNSVPPSLQFAQLFADVVDAYNLDLNPILDTGQGGSDHTSFLEYGYNSILAIEDDSTGDFNPYYHGPGDTPAHTDPAYFTNFVKASLATFVHKSGCLIYSGIGSLDGHVTAAAGGAPVADATVVAEDNAGHSVEITTDPTGYYTKTLLANTYTVTASAYGYLPATVSGIVVTTDTVSTQDFSLLSAPTYIVSGTVTDSLTGAPLLAEISFTGSPVTVWTDPINGSYLATLPQGGYTMQVRADLHRPQVRDIILDHDQTQNFTLEPLPCVLLVDDDQNGPNVRNDYTTALDGLGVGYDIWDTDSGDPTLSDILGYSKVLWFTGYPYAGTFSTSNETDVAAYLDSGGNFFLSSQDYLYDMGLTTFGQNYLHISSFDNDVNQTTVTGQNVFNGLGPYSLTYDFTNYSDIVNPDAQAQLAFSGNVGNAAVSYAGTNFNTVFFGYPYEAIVTLADRQAVMDRLLGFFGSCEAQPISGLAATNDSPTYLGNTTHFAASVEEGTPPITFQWDFGDGIAGAGQTPAHTYDTIGEYTAIVTATNSVSFASTTTLVSIVDQPISGLEAANDSPTALGDTTHLTATIEAGTNAAFTWNFGDGTSGSGAFNAHTYPAVGTYTAVVTATNGTNSASDTTLVTVEIPIDGLTAENDSPTMLGNTTYLTASVVAGSNVIYAWDFGDGMLGSGEVVTHTFLSVGSYTASVTASNSISFAGAVTLVTVTPSCEPVDTTNFTWLPLEPVSGEGITFTSTANGSEPITYTWNFGDGAVGAGITTTHSYVEGGDYTVMLTATNACGVASAEHIINVTPACEPVGMVDFAWLPVEPFSDELVTFTGSAEGSGPISFTWNFGDGAEGTGLTTTHSYAEPGTYTVALSSTNACSTDQESKQVTILQKVWEFFLPLITR